MDVSEEAYLSHYGVKGMRWGVRKDRDGVSRKTDREARKDAQEFARAKMYYGKGAGNRRKLIKATVEAKSKRDASYKKAFDKHFANQDMSAHASKARSERSRTDKKETTRKTAGAVARRVTGEWGTSAAFTTLAFSGAAYLQSPRGRANLNRGIRTLNNAANEVRRRNGARVLNDYIRRFG